MSDLTTQSPAEIDQQLADLAEARATAVSRTYGFDDLRRYAKSEDRSRRLGRHDWVMSPAEAADVLRALLAAEAADDKYGYGRLSNGSEIGNSRRAVAAYDEYVAEMARIKDAEAPLTAEYVRRGGWQPTSQPAAQSQWPLPRRLLLAGAALGALSGLLMILLGVTSR